jgi:hypothetical protein
MRRTLTRARSGRPHRLLLTALAVPAVLAMSACSGGSSGGGPVSVTGTAGPAGLSSSSPTPRPSAAGSGSGSGSTSAAGGSSGGACTSGEQQTPRGVTPVTTADLDGDGKPDRLWLGDGGTTSAPKRYLGVIFSAGGGTSITFSSAAPQSATAVAGRLAGGPAIILLDTGRSVQLYAVVDCAITATKNAQGQQYTFDKGFTGYGTGVGCPTLSGGEQLAGYLAKSTSGGKYTVTRTTITVTDGGRRAANGSKATLGTGLSASSSTVKTAQAVTCAGSGTANEPTT